jgi:serine/threonine-protein kinase
LAKNPDDRYQSARELAAEAARALVEKTVAVPVAPTTPAPQPPTQAWQGPPPATGPQATGPQGTGPQGMTYPGPHRSGPTFAAPQPTYQREGTPPGGYPPGSGANAMHFQPRPHGGPLSGNRRWWVIGAALAAVIAVVIGLVVFASGGDNPTDDAAATTTTTRPTTTTSSRPASTPPPAPAPPPPANVPSDALQGLLLPPEEISERMQKPGMTLFGTEYAPIEGTVTPPNCYGAWGPAYQATYNGSGYTALVIQLVVANPTHKLAQAVVSFPDANAAKVFFDRQVADWKSCQNTSIKFEYRGEGTDADLGVPSIIAGVLSLKLVPTTATVEGQQCERNMTVRANVIVDVRACSPTIGSAGLSIATAIADKIK